MDAARLDDKPQQITIPIANEVRKIASLHARACMATTERGYTEEPRLVDDGGKDGPAVASDSRTVCNPRGAIGHSRRSPGETAAMMAGSDCASGDSVEPMDNDLQKDRTNVGRVVPKLGLLANPHGPNAFRNSAQLP